MVNGPDELPMPLPSTRLLHLAMLRQLVHSTHARSANIAGKSTCAPQQQNFNLLTVDPLQGTRDWNHGITESTFQTCRAYPVSVATYIESVLGLLHCVQEC
eukprot:6065889-Amphidinium_carterae.1